MNSIDAGLDMLAYRSARIGGTPGALSRGERELWCAVILQAFVDIGAVTPPTAVRHAPAKQVRGHAEESYTTTSQGRLHGMQSGAARAPYAKKNCDEASRWLLRDRRDFIYVCTLAGIAPSVIRRAAQLFFG